jgi:hypothetical protein
MAAETRLDRAEARMALNDARFEKRMRGFEKIARICIAERRRMEKTSQQRAAAQNEKINILIQSQQVYQASLKAFLDPFHRGGRAR